MKPSEQWQRYAEILSHRVWPYAEPNDDAAEAIVASIDAAKEVADELEKADQ